MEVSKKTGKTQDVILRSDILSEIKVGVIFDAVRKTSFHVLLSGTAGTMGSVFPFFRGKKED